MPRESSPPRVRSPRPETHLAEAGHRVRGQRRLGTDGAAEDGEGVGHVGGRLGSLPELLVRFADRHVRLGDDRRVLLHVVLGVLREIVLERLLEGYRVRVRVRVRARVPRLVGLVGRLALHEQWSMSTRVQA